MALVLNFSEGEILLRGCYSLLHTFHLLFFQIICTSQLHQLGHQRSVLVLKDSEVVFEVKVSPLIDVAIKQHLKALELISLR